MQREGLSDSRNRQAAQKPGGGKTRTRSGSAIRGSSDSEEEDNSIYDLNWEPEGGSVFKVPLHEFYNRKSEIPERFKGAHDWTTECLVGKLQGTKRPNKSSEGLLYGIKFDDGNATAWYMVPPDI